MHRTMIALGAAAFLSACSEDEPPACRVASDCATGICTAAGRCAVLPEDAGQLSDAGPNLEDGGLLPDAGTLSCVPNHDGRIDRTEVNLAPSLVAKYRVATSAQVDMTGSGTGNERRWDLAGSLANDHDVDFETIPVQGAWFAASFPDATYAARLSIQENLLGVFRASDTSLELLGVVSPDDGFTRTELTYSPPVLVLKFPLEEGQTWTTSASVSGVALGVITGYLESYSQRVEGRGVLATPYGDFPVLRVLTQLSRSIPSPAIIRQVGFFAECFGAVGTVVSTNGETQDEFSSADEVRRFTR